MAVKAAFLLAGLCIQVSEDWVVGTRQYQSVTSRCGNFQHFEAKGLFSARDRPYRAGRCNHWIEVKNRSLEHSCVSSAARSFSHSNSFDTILQARFRRRR
jgi:hypothetical protein